MIIVLLGMPMVFGILSMADMLLVEDLSLSR